MEDFEFFQPESLEATLTLLDQEGGALLAGGTDLLPAMRRGKQTPVRVIDLSCLAPYRTITETDNQIELGALCTHDQIANSDLILTHAPLLAKACASVGSRQTRERGTLGGNLANASPAADLGPALLVLDAQVHINSISSERVIPIDQFFLSPGRTCLAANEIITGVHFALPDRHGGADFIKLGKRNGMAISIASVAVFLQAENGHITSARVAMGSVAPRPIRCSHVENSLTGKIFSADLFHEAAAMAAEDILPISDVRASAEYRLRAGLVLVERALNNAWAQHNGRTV